MRSPKVVLALGAALVVAMLAALWLTSAPMPEAPTAVEATTPLPPPPELVRARASGDLQPPALSSLDAGSPGATTLGTPIRPGVNSPLPPEQWPERIRPTERTVVTPPPSEDLPQVSKEEIREAIQAVTPLVARCFNDAAVRNPGDQKVKLKFTIQGQGLSGHFQDGEVVESTIVDPWVQACFLEALTDADFPAPSGGGTVTVTYPFSFVDAKDAGPG
ncbi:MAG: AgmX/PglI C-terminal domain-containing protein [Myxococcota bacterium]|nr:AgmX/PglI C-terminal domain-containing protein [Myxococcota bacterium]